MMKPQIGENDFHLMDDRFFDHNHRHRSRHICVRKENFVRLTDRLLMIAVYTIADEIFSHGRLVPIFVYTHKSIYGDRLIDHIHFGFILYVSRHAPVVR